MSGTVLDIGRMAPGSEAGEMTLACRELERELGAVGRGYLKNNPSQCVMTPRSLAALSVRST